MNKFHSTIAVATCATLLYACTGKPTQGPLSRVPTGFAALADTAPAPTARDSAFARLGADSSACQYIEGAFNVEEAMELVYGLYDRDIECSKWICKVTDYPGIKGKRNRSGHAFTRPAGQFTIKDGKGGQILLLTETLNRESGGWENCHACAPILGAALFTEAGGAWFVESVKKDIAQIGAWGNLPPSTLIAIGPSTWGLRFDYGYTAQGTSIGGMALMSPVNGSFRIIADVHTRFSNEEMFLEGEGEGLKYHYDSDLTWIAGDNEQVFDMHVHTTGKRPTDGMDGIGPIRSFDETRIYTYKDDQYVLYDSTLLAL